MTATILAILGAFAAMIGSAGLGGMLKTWLDHKRGKQQDTDQIAMGLVIKLEQRVETLERALEQERARCDAVEQIHRHRINNQRMMIHGLLLLFEMPAAKRKDALERIRADLSALEQAEAAEKGALAGAQIAGAAE